MANPSDSHNDKLPGGITESACDDFYHKLRQTIDGYVAKHTNSDISEMILFVPDFFYLLTKLAADPRISSENKSQIIVAIAYFLSPLDIIPDALFGYGWLDDLYLALIVTKNLLKTTDMSILKEYWPEDDDIAAIIETTLKRLKKKLSSSATKRILDRLRQADEGTVFQENNPDR